MRTTTRLGCAVLLAGALAPLGQGCVSLHTYEQQKQREEALLEAYRHANTVVQNYKDEIERRDNAIRSMQGKVGEAESRVAQANRAIDQERTKLEAEYQRMLSELQAAGGQFVINQSTGGIVLENDIFFASGQATLKPEALAALDTLVQKLREDRFAAAKIEVAGHTDADPITHSKWEDNYQLSAERARSVLRFFIERGIEGARIHLSGYGPIEPRSDRKDENRRVEILLRE